MMMRAQTRAKMAKTAKKPTSVHTNASSLPSARDRLLAAADELFYGEGVHVVGIDRIVERAGVAKASLYSIFGSKDELVRAYLENHFRQRQTGIGNILAAHDTPRERLLGIFGELEAALEGSEFRGCRFISAGAEARPGDASEVVADRYRAWLRSLFIQLAQAAGATDATAVGRQLSLLYDGAAVAARMDQDRRGAATAVHHAAAALLDAAIPPKSSNRRAKTG
jgi:AcrR family transcriptional regulator